MAAPPSPFLLSTLESCSSPCILCWCSMCVTTSPICVSTGMYCKTSKYTTSLSKSVYENQFISTSLQEPFYLNQFIWINPSCFWFDLKTVFHFFFLFSRQISFQFFSNYYVFFNLQNAVYRLNAFQTTLYWLVEMM